MSIVRCWECETYVDTDFTDECRCEDGIIKRYDYEKNIVRFWNDFD